MSKRTSLRFGIDHLKYNFPEPYTNSDFANKFIGLSENSNETIGHWFGWDLKGIYNRKGKTIFIQYLYKTHPVLQLKKYNGKDFVSEQKKAVELKNEIDKTDSEIDQMVYELYGLTEEEVAIVEKG